MTTIHEHSFKMRDFEFSEKFPQAVHFYYKFRRKTNLQFNLNGESKQYIIIMRSSSFLTKIYLISLILEGVTIDLHVHTLSKLLEHV